MSTRNGTSSIHDAIMQRIPIHALSQLQDLDLFLPRAAGSTMLAQPWIDHDQDDQKVMSGMPAKGHEILGDIPIKGQAMPPEEMVERPEEDQSEDEPTNLTPTTPKSEAELQERRLLPEVALPFAHLDASDGSIKPLTVDEVEELKNHIQSPTALDQESSQNH